MQKLSNYIDIEELVTFFYFDFAKGYSFKGEQHDFWEMVYVDKGVVEIMADTKHYVLDAGQIVFHQPNEFHSICSGGETAPNVVVISFHCQSQGMDYFKKKILHLSSDQRKILGHVVKCASEQLDRKHRLIEDTPINQQLLKNMLEGFLLQLMLQSKVSKMSESLPTKEKMEKGITIELKAYMKKHLHHNVCIDDLVTEMNLSSSYIKKVFKAQTGESPIRYFRMFRIAKAKELMRESDMSFTEIAHHLGYGSIHYFSKQFKDIVGMTPTEFSKSVIQDNRIDTIS